MLLLTLTPIFAHAKTEKIKVSGFGPTPEAAIRNALSLGIEQFHGVAISSKRLMEFGLIEEDKVFSISEGTVNRYEVLALEEQGNGYRAELELKFIHWTPLETGLRSAVLPGWGQYLKHSPWKGTTFLVATTGLVVAGILSAQHSNELNDQIKTASSTYTQDFYYDEATKYHQISNIAFGAAAALYIFNVIDAATASNSAKQLNETKTQSTRFGIAPIIRSDSMSGLTIGLNFSW